MSEPSQPSPPAQGEGKTLPAEDAPAVTTRVPPFLPWLLLALWILWLGALAWLGRAEWTVPKLAPREGPQPEARP